MKKTILILVLFLLAACSKNSPLEDASKILLRIEKREITKDQITEFKIFQNGLIESFLRYSSPASAEKVFSTKFYQIDKDLITKWQETQKAFSEMKYENHFPWKRNFKERGDVISFEFVSAGLPKTYFYYTGEKSTSPELFLKTHELLEESLAQAQILSSSSVK